MNEQEKSKEGMLLVFEEKIDNLLEAVREIKDSINCTSEQVQVMKIDLVSLHNRTDQQQKEIDKLYDKNTRNMGWIMGVGATVASAILVAVLRIVFGS